VLASLPSPEAPLELLPVGAGEPKRVSLPGLSQRGAAFFPDGRSILVNGYEAGHGPRLYKVSLDGGPPKAVTPEGAFLGAEAVFTISPDGQWAAAIGLAPAPASGFTVWLHPIDKGECRVLAGVVPPAVPLRWSADGTAVLVAEAGPPVRIVRVEVTTGQRSVIKELVPADPLARAGSWAAVTPDGASYVYAYSRRLSELYLVEGLR
jgi:Tol biopolymer transport system component